MNALFFEKKQQKCLWVQKLLYLCSRNQKRDVAQLASAPRSGRGGRKFESSHPDYKDEDVSFDISSSFIHTDKICTFILSFL